MTGGAPVLIVSASAGTGHVRAGEAMRAALALEGIAAEHVDVLSLGPSWVRRVYGSGFGVLAARAPRLWREIYELADGPDGDRARWGPIAARVLFREFQRVLRSRSWRCCLCTHFLPSQLAAGRPGVPPFLQVMTDFALHRYWVQPRVRRHFVASPELAEQVSSRVAGAAVIATGIPVDPSFGRPPAWQRARAELGLDAAGPVALVMGGGLGLGIEAAAGAALKADVPGLRVVAVCGRNVDALARLRARHEPGGRLQALGYVEDMARVYAAADVVVTKPGGLTCSEALAVGRPLLLTRPVPGHEAGNVDYLVGRAAALSAPTDGAVTDSLRRLFREPDLLLGLARGARAAGAPDAAGAIARLVRQGDVLDAVA